MASKSPDDGKADPSLELPSLGLPRLRRRKKAREAPQQPPEESSPEPMHEPMHEPVHDDRDATRPLDRPPAEESSDDTAVQQAVQAPPSAPVTEAEPEEPTGSDTDPGRRKVVGEGLSLPALPGRAAAITTGLIVGVVGTVLTFLALAGCEAIKGTSTCGGPGFFLLVAILIVMILAGTVLLKAWQIGDPGSTSFLAVGTVAVFALVMLIDAIFSAWMFLIIPIVSAGAYALSEWVTTRFVEDESPGIGPDVR